MLGCEISQPNMDGSRSNAKVEFTSGTPNKKTATLSGRGFLTQIQKPNYAAAISDELGRPISLKNRK